MLIGLLFTIGLALAVVGVVAYPHLREGAPLLTPEGERLAREARQKAQELAGNAADALVSRDRGAQDGSPVAGSSVAGSPVPGRAPAPGTAPGARTGQALPHAGTAPYPVPGAASQATGPGPVAQPGAGQAPDGAAARLDSTRLVWASPPPQSRPTSATPVPGASQLGDQRTGPGQTPAAR